MADFELLELAAKAADLDYHIDRLDGCPKIITGGRVWNPLVFDGDALRLAVKMGFGISIPLMNDRTDVVTFGRTLLNAIEAHNGNPYAATRRAIVRAAAEIARAPEQPQGAAIQRDGGEEA